jgi:hypothetical protein
MKTLKEATQVQASTRGPCKKDWVAMVVVTAAATEWATATSTFPSPSRPEWQREPRNFDFDYGLKG